MSAATPSLDAQISKFLQLIISRCDLYPHVIQGHGETLQLIAENDTLRTFNTSDILFCLQYDNESVIRRGCSHGLLIVGGEAFGVSWYNIDSYHHFYMNEIESKSYYLEDYDIKDDSWTSIFSPRAEGSTKPIVESMLAYIEEQEQKGRTLRSILTNLE